jgi:hypothetical protein
MSNTKFLEAGPLPCTDLGDLYFSDRAEDQLEAQGVCVGCPLIRECLVLGLESSDGYGVWGGRTPREIRGALGIDEDGRRRDGERALADLNCPSCLADWTQLKVWHDPDAGGRWGQRDLECTRCAFLWESGPGVLLIEAEEVRRGKPAKPTKPRKSPKPVRLCDIEGCEERHVAKGLCARHYHQSTYTRVTPAPPTIATNPCSVDGCEFQSRAGGMCTPHYGKARYAAKKAARA